VEKSDLVFDTIDFLALPAIHRLHRAASDYQKPILTAFNVGFGAFLWYFPSDGKSPTIENYLKISNVVESNQLTYADSFKNLFVLVKDNLDAEVVAHVADVIGKMRDGTPCPASQVAAGVFAVAALAVSTICSIFEGLPVPSSPKAIVHSFRSNRTSIIDLPTSLPE
jgi:molybdopterin-synthase adenylyltransferase